MLNKAQLIGRLGGDPDVRYLPDGTPTASITLATTRRWKDRNTHERKEETEWHRIVFFAGLAKVVIEYVKKGQQIYVEGRLKTRKWQDRDGVERYTTEIIASEMHMLTSKSNGTGPAATNVPAGDDYDDDLPY
ncbi:single-stranded DNA-binding protein [Methylomonas rapida]|uniref:single-stranded DNA-binding protein n=1 Tax=Methylomonas rapida TaxID=2963939 RepID=UPI0020CBBDB5|nr:single-stranded DNA-binding protein [Methylomonas rapida]